MLKLDLGVINFTRRKVQEKNIEKTVFNTLKILRVNKNTEISLVFCGEKRIRSLNKKFRKKDKATDVLSFGFEGFAKGDFLNLGEIIICVPYAKKQAKKAGISLEKEMALLASHGTIHLLGIDHERSLFEEKKTERIQKKALSKVFGV